MRIIIADSSAIVRAILEQNIKQNKDNEVISSVSTCLKIIGNIKTLSPDVIVCGNNSSDENEKDALNTICNQLHIPVILLVSEEDADSPAPFFSKFITRMEKPNLKDYSQVFFNKLLSKIEAISQKKDLPPVSFSSDKTGFKVLCLGASTGGPTAVADVLNGLGKDFPLPVLYTQHIEIDTDKNLADWLNDVCKYFRVKLAKDGELAVPGTVYMAPADKHLVINFVNDKGYPVLKLSDEAPERFLRPAVNKLFKSAALKYKNTTLAVLLTGMGADGANGCKEISDIGGWTIVEDKSTCAVFGMPAAAIEIGGAKEILPRYEIPKRILELVGR